MEFDLAIFLGAVAIAAAIYFGLWSFRKDIGNKLSDIRDRVMVMGITVDKAWELLKIRFGVEGRTVERDLSNFGKARISAKPGIDSTVYIIDVEEPFLQDNLINKLVKTTGLEDVERESFDNRVATVTTPTATRMLISIPSTDAKKCTKYMTIFLKWLDSTYYDSLVKIKDYEEPIEYLIDQT